MESSRINIWKAKKKTEAIPQLMLITIHHACYWKEKMKTLYLLDVLSRELY